MNESSDRHDAGGEERPGAPDDLELMRWLDGELDDDEAAAFEKRLEGDEVLRDKVWSLELARELLDEAIAADDRADGIADAVMAQLETASHDDEEQPASSAPAGAARLPASPSGAANDNARPIFGLAALAAAAAAGMFFWGMRGEEADLQVRRPPYRKPPVAVAEAPTPSVAPTVAVEASAAAADEDDDPDVEVAAVDFGSHSGSVFYVSGEQSSTAVVWITDAGDE